MALCVHAEVTPKENLKNGKSIFMLQLYRQYIFLHFYSDIGGDKFSFCLWDYIVKRKCGSSSFRSGQM